MALCQRLMLYSCASSKLCGPQPYRVARRVLCNCLSPSASGRRPLVIATRESKLAQEQTRQVQQLLLAAAQLRGEPLELSTLAVRSAGDASPSAPLRSLGSGAFTEALDLAVLERRADMAAHSLKDCPATLTEGLVLAACLARADPRDVLIANEAKSLGELVPGSRVGTSSSRRSAQIRHAFPHLQVVDLRGNVEARLERIRAREISATVLALAGLQRLGFADLAPDSALDFACTALSMDQMLPAACQGAVGVVCREDDPWVRQLLSAISHRPTLLEVAAERACLAALLGSPEAGQAGAAFPSLAWGCHADYHPEDRTMDLVCFVSDLDGEDLLRYADYDRPVESPEDAEALGALWGGILRMCATGQGWIPPE